MQGLNITPWRRESLAPEGGNLTSLLRGRRSNDKRPAIVISRVARRVSCDHRLSAGLRPRCGTAQGMSLRDFSATVLHS